MGRFISADTIIPEPGNPMAWDRYAYVNNNPVKYNDPTGHCIGPLSIICALVVLALPAITVAAPQIVTEVLPQANLMSSWHPDPNNPVDVAFETTNTILGAYAIADAGVKLSKFLTTNPVETIGELIPATGKVSSQGEEATTLFHYTNETGLNGILESNELRPSLSSVNPNDVRYGEGQYLTDIVPGSKTPDQVSRQLLGFPWQGQKFTHFIEINTAGLNVVEGRPGVFVIPNTTPLDLTDRIVSFGAVRAK